ncbi:MAG: type II toxin-antitoxin system ParD family antitoxin [Acidobacteriia bacterium]|nr:type II toxin-antitoxin system ParD family antitoxin [Terriglobia bacterium]
MANRTTVNISITPELDEFLQSRVESGRYQTTSEVVREARRLLQRQETERDAAFQQLKAKSNAVRRRPRPASCLTVTKYSMNCAK